MSNFIPVCKTSDVPPAGKAVFEVGERFVMICRVDGEFFALDDCCTHDGGPLGEGRLDGFVVVCPRHGAKFDVRDGRVLAFPATQPIPAHKVKVENGQVFVKLCES